MARELERHGLDLVLFDPEGGDFAGGERGYLCDPGRRDHCLRTIEDAIATARRLGCRRLNVLAGNRVDGVDADAMRRTVVETLRRAAPLAGAAGITLLIEVLNTWESPRYFLDRSRLALEIVREVAAPNVRFQFEDVPGRHEPGTGEVNYQNVLAALERAGYEGYVGLEYRPAGKTEESLGWLPREARARR